jgi:hypothetical protein
LNELIVNSATRTMILLHFVNRGQLKKNSRFPLSNAMTSNQGQSHCHAVNYDLRALPYESLCDCQLLSSIAEGYKKAFPCISTLSIFEVPSGTLLCCSRLTT